MEKGEASSEEAQGQRLEPLNGTPTRIRRWRDDDDDASADFFMSEPSVSEAESPEYRHNRHYTGSLLSPRQGSPEGDEDLLPIAPSPPPPNPMAYPSSPGTSLSSWDSPHLFRRKFQLYFSSDKWRQEGAAQLSSSAAARGGGEESERQKQQQAQASSNSTSSASTKMKRQSADFLRELKRQSVGALTDARPDDFDSDSNINGTDSREVVAVIRNRGVQGLNQNRTVARADTDQDETIVMDLTASDDEEGETTDTAEPLHWEQTHSADDQKMADRPRRRHRRSRSDGVLGHRMTRSGDSAAASRMPSETDWKRMQIDRLPIPSSMEDYDDEDEHGEERVIRKAASLGQDRTSPASRRKELLSDENVDFSVGAAPSENGRGSKRTRRNQRIRRPQPRGLQHPETESTKKGEGMTRDMFSRFALQSTGSIPAYIHRSSPTSLSASEHNSERVESDSSGQGPQTRSHSATEADLRIPARVYRSYSQPDILQPTNALLSRDMVDTPGYGSNFSWISSNRPSVSTRHSQSTLDSQARSQSTWDNQARYQFINGIYRTPDDDSYVVDSASDYSHSDNDTDEVERDIHRAQLRYNPDVELDEAERLLEDKDYRGEPQHVLRKRSPVFPNFGKTAPPSATRATYKPTTHSHDSGNFPTFVCPVCKTRQREFFTVSSAPQQAQGPAGYLAFYFALYVVASLFIFGLEEGWKPLDCVYFAVITLTTAGLGDFVPTSDGAKILCAIFIYFGVACIGLLLGSYLASMLDEKSYKEAKQNRVENCTNCARLKSIKAMQRKTPRKRGTPPRISDPTAMRTFMSERNSHDMSHLGPHVLERDEKQAKRRRSYSSSSPGSEDSSRLKAFDISSPPLHSTKSSGRKRDSDDADKRNESKRNLGVIDSKGKPMNTMSPEPTRQIPGPPGHPPLSPFTTEMLGRQSHTRHMSFDAGTKDAFTVRKTEPARQAKNTVDLPRQPISESIPEDNPYSPRSWTGGTRVVESETEEDSDDESTGSETSSSEANSFADTAAGRLKTAKYVFLTLKQAVMNSILIIAVGGIGFFTIEGMSAVNSFYFTTVLLTTVGYGDIVPVTPAGKLFATIYVLVGGTVLLHNMSLISMIPLELRRRRIEQTVLTQFGDQLDDATLRELATGPLVRNIQLHSHSAAGLEECTREMFALAMLVRLGKVTETDIKQTFAAFRRLDVDNDGYLSSKAIIAGMLQRHRSMMEIAPPPPPPLNEKSESMPVRSWYWFGSRSGSLHVTTKDGDFRFERPDQGPPTDSEHSSLLENNTGYDSFHGDPRGALGPDVERGYPNNSYQR